MFNNDGLKKYGKKITYFQMLHLITMNSSHFSYIYLRIIISKIGFKKSFTLLKPLSLFFLFCSSIGKKIDWILLEYDIISPVTKYANMLSQIL